MIRARIAKSIPLRTHERGRTEHQITSGLTMESRDSHGLKGQKKKCIDRKDSTWQEPV